MNGEIFHDLLIRGILALILSAVLAWRLYDEREINDRTRRFMRPVISPILLPSSETRLL